MSCFFSMTTNNSITMTKISRRELTQFHFNFLIQSFQPVCLEADTMMRITCGLLLCTISSANRLHAALIGVCFILGHNQSTPLEANQAVQPVLSSGTESKGRNTWGIQVLLALCNSTETLISQNSKPGKGWQLVVPSVLLFLWRDLVHWLVHQG